MIELVVAMGVMFLSLSALAYSATVGFVDAGFARQRQGATGLANRTLEIIRALPVEDVKRGLDTTDLVNTAGTTDTNITTGGTTPQTYFYKGELIRHGPNTPVAPLVPHQRQEQVPGATYTVSVYITTSAADPDVYRASVVVTWAHAVRAGVAAKVEAETLLSFPLGCQSPSTHPFAAPCEPSFYGGAKHGPGGISITGTISGVALRDAAVTLPEQGSDLQTEQVRSIQGIARTSGVSIRYTDGTADDAAGAILLTTASSNNPTETKPAYDSKSESQSGSEKIKAGSANHRLRIRAGTETATSISTVAANYPSPNQPCPTSTSSQTDNLPCGNVRSVQTDTVSSFLDLARGSSARLFSVGPTETYARTDRDVPGLTAATPCTGDGCVRGTGRRQLGEVLLGGLPSDVGSPHANWAGYLVRITGFTDEVTAGAGSGSGNPAFTRSGDLQYWNGAGYTSVSLATSTGADLPIPQVTAGDAVVTARMSSTTGSTMSDPQSCSGCPRLSAEARSPSPVLGTFTLTVGSAAALTINVDLGTLLAKATYAPAPNVL